MNNSGDNAAQGELHRAYRRYLWLMRVTGWVYVIYAVLSFDLRRLERADSLAGALPLAPALLLLIVAVFVLRSRARWAALGGAALMIAMGASRTILDLRENTDTANKLVTLAFMVAALALLILHARNSPGLAAQGRQATAASVPLEFLSPAALRERLDVIEFSTVTRSTQTYWRGQLLADRIVLTSSDDPVPQQVPASEFAITPVEAPGHKRFKVTIRIGGRQLEGFTMGRFYSNYQQWRGHLGLQEDRGLWVPHI